jgi:alanyl-tRNA synthetase
MTSAQIRQDFLDFFKSKQHTIVPSSSLLPDSPNLLFTNAGMNQFVPIFLEQQKPSWNPPRVADTQKCIRAGGKHNDLEDVGLDTYHHTFFEILGNWSFGDYFKKEAIEWAWELVVNRWKFPAQRLYATVYQPGPGEPSEFDQEAHDHWARLFREADLDPAIHIVNGNKSDNFWMMGDTGPCGPCSELHVDLTPDGDTRGALVNKDDPRCIEIWNLVFIQFNVNPDGSFVPLPKRHVDTGMGFERVTAIIQGTKNFSDFSGTISNYETDIFRPIFDEIEKLSSKKYASTLPDRSQPSTLNSQQATDVAFRVIADHIRTLSFAIADGIIPSNEGRGYVLRRILRRAVRYGRTLSFHEPFFFQLVDVVVQAMGVIFPEVHAKQKQIKETIGREEEAFNKTLDTGLRWFNSVSATAVAASLNPEEFGFKEAVIADVKFVEKTGADDWSAIIKEARARVPDWDISQVSPISADKAFMLYDTYGFPLDLTELIARERGLTVDVAGFDRLMEQQRERARNAQKKRTINIEDVFEYPTKFVGYDRLEAEASLLIVSRKLANDGSYDDWGVVDVSPFYAEMGGQVGDSGQLTFLEGGQVVNVVNALKLRDTFYLKLADIDGPQWTPTEGAPVHLVVDVDRRRAIERHHTVTHLLHWALHEIVSRDAAQKGSYVGPDKLTFDFSSTALTPEQKRDVEKLVNEKIAENTLVSWQEIPYVEAKKRSDIQQFFGDKYGDTVRVVQIGGEAKALNGYSMELCGGTHVHATGDIETFRIVKEEAIAAGIRRIEAVAGGAAREWAQHEAARQREKFETLARKKSDIAALPAFADDAQTAEMLKKVDARAVYLEKLEAEVRDWEKQHAKSAEAELQSRAAGIANELAASHAGKDFLVTEVPNADGKLLQAVADGLKSKIKGPIFLAGVSDGRVALIASVPKELTAKFQANKLIQEIVPIVGGKGGGRPENAQGAGNDPAKLEEALAKARHLLA